ncbi:PKD domain-containing protein [Solirubrobacter pauli]|uniref:PKD domain-containing protein n=1 Tax=Solirubrobacter pauli TaxID=166793 RepID=A0A660KUY2_9ACTN|nr:ThuA domain-containing protein [Solirubrobacter pauli]RKQ84793.1 PKD domain-containing protein [Solirubrobacter pauli]
MFRSGTAVGLLAAALALGAPATGAAKSTPKFKLRTVGTPPATAAPGASFTLKGQLVNTARSTQHPQLTITLRRTKASRAIKLTTKTLPRVKAKRTLRFSATVKVPASLAAGGYHVRACVSGACKYSAKRLSVRKPVVTPAPKPAPVVTPITPGATPAPTPAPVEPTLDFPATTGEFDVLVFRQGADATVATIRELGKTEKFGVAVTGDTAAFDEDYLKRYRAVVFAGVTGDVLSDAQQAEFEAYFKEGGGFLALGDAIDAEPEWDFLTGVIGARAKGAPAASAEATIKVADRGHVASRSLPQSWKHTDRYLNFDKNVRGVSHVLATVDENTYAGGTMGFDHPIAWCKNYQGGRSFYTGVQSFTTKDAQEHLAGAIEWTGGVADRVYSDCGATVVANYQQTKISAPPNLNEPIGFDILPDGRVLQTARNGQLRLHDQAKGETKVIATLPVYTNSEDGLYGPAIDNDFASNQWVYLFYAPETVRITKCDGTTADVKTPAGSAPELSADPCVWQDTWGGYFQLSRFKFVDGENPHLDLGSEQKILQVANNRGACCHVAGDIDFDRHNNLWLVTGDDTPSGGGNSGGFAPFNDQKTDEIQTVKATAPFTLTFNGQTTASIAANATAAQITAALEALSNVAPGDVIVDGGAANATVKFDGAYASKNVPAMTATGATVATTKEGDLFVAPHNDARRSAQNTNDLRGKVLRIKVKADGSYDIPQGNLYPLVNGQPVAKTRPEIYAMGFRNPFRIQVDEHDVAYVTDYSPDSAVPQNFRGPAGTGRVEIVRKASNYGWPLCVSPTLPYYRWNFNTDKPLDATPTQHDCGNATRGPKNESRWNTGLDYGPAISQPDIWYSFRDNAEPALGTPCLAYYDGSGGTCPQLFPELGNRGGVAPHGAVKYRFDPSNPSETKFPAYYDDAIFLGEFGQDVLREVRLDDKGGIFKINDILDCGDFSADRNALPFECDGPMDMQFGADGAFYLLTYGDGFFSPNPDAGMYKFEYVGGKRAPQAQLSTNVTNGRAPLAIQFSSDGSRDPDPGDSITYAWDFTNDGTVDSIDPNPSFIYTADGVYTAKLTVTDSSGKSDVKTTQITVGNTQPKITITTPAEGGFFDWGDRIPFTVTVEDAEDGPGDCSKVEVTFVLLHDDHGHGEQNLLGCSGTLQTLAEDVNHGGHLAGGISVTYTDKGANGQPALTTIQQTVVQAKKHEGELMTSRSGTASGTSYLGAPSYASSLDPGDWLAVNRKVDLRNINQLSLNVASCGSTVGAPAGTLELRLDSPTGPLLKAIDVKVTDNGPYCAYVPAFTTLTTPVTDPGGAHSLYLVPKAVDGGLAKDLFLVDFISFGGDGIGTLKEETK